MTFVLRVVGFCVGCGCDFTKDDVAVVADSVRKASLLLLDKDEDENDDDDDDDVAVLASVDHEDAKDDVDPRPEYDNFEV